MIQNLEDRDAATTLVYGLAMARGWSLQRTAKALVNKAGLTKGEAMSVARQWFVPKAAKQHAMNPESRRFPDGPSAVQVARDKATRK